MIKSGDSERSDLETDDCIAESELCELTWPFGKLEGEN